MSSAKGIIRVLGLCCISPLVFAADLPGSQDLPSVARQVDAQIVDYRPTEEKERIYPMGAIRKISGKLRYDGQATARGQVTAITYELPAEHSSSTAFKATREALQEQGAQLLFWCQARDCGESSLWANEVLGNAKLVGADGQQELPVAAPGRPSGQLSGGAVRHQPRQSQRAYLHVEQMDASAPLGHLAADLCHTAASTEKHRRLDFPLLGAEPDATWLDPDFPWIEPRHHLAGQLERTQR
jgi:hypothetical protein